MTLTDVAPLLTVPPSPQVRSDRERARKARNYRRWVANHPEARREFDRRWRVRNQERLRVYKREWARAKRARLRGQG